LGNIYLHQGNLALAEQIFSKDLQYFMELDDLLSVVYFLERLASVAVRKRWPEKAVKLYAWADGMRRGSRPNADQEDVDQDMTAVREMIDEETLAAAHAAGKKMTLEQAIALATEMNHITED
jgi:hypothetical protein